MMTMLRPAHTVRTLAALATILTLLIAILVPGTAQAHGTTRVVDGTAITQPTFDARYPWMVSVQWKLSAAEQSDYEEYLDRPLTAVDTHTCGGSLVAPNLVLTAAHCVSWEGSVDPGSSYTVLSGRRDLLSSDGSTITVDDIYVHPMYDDTLRGEYDAALLKLSGNVAGITPVSMIGAADGALWGGGAGLAVTPGSGPFVAGWGARAVAIDPFWGDPLPSGIPTAPYAGEIPIHADTSCADGGAGAGVGWGRLYVQASMMCAGELDTSQLGAGISNGTAPCYGDSGGPLIVSDGGGGYKLAGIVSFGTMLCSSRTASAVFTKVSSVRAWVDGAHQSPPRINWALEDDEGEGINPAPRVRGDAVAGNTATCTNGHWTGDDLSYSYLWWRYKPSASDEDEDDEFDEDDFLDELFSRRSRQAAGDIGARRGMAPGGRRLTASQVAVMYGFEIISGETANRYRLRSTDRKYYVGCAVTASNATWADFWLAEPDSRVVVTGLLGNARRVRIRDRSTSCNEHGCSVTLYLKGRGRKGVERVGGYLIIDDDIVPVSARRSGKRTWTLHHGRHRGKVFLTVWATDDLGRRSPMFTGRYTAW